MVKENLLDERTFCAPYGVRTLSRLEKMYNTRATHNPSNWQGPIWGISNYMVFRGLVDYGFDKEARELAEKTISLFGQDLQKEGALHEYYDPDSGAPIINKGFQNWNYLVLNMIAWMEHRRWNAFVRTEGFRRPPNLEERLREMEEGRCTADRKELELCAYKNVLFRLHPNLVECYRGREEKAHDLLDAASAMRQYANLVIKGKETTVDLKKYDYPNEKYGPRLSREELIACLTDVAPAEADFDLNRAWTALEQKYPAVKECEDTDHSGHYYAGRVLKLLMNKRT